MRKQLITLFFVSAVIFAGCSKNNDDISPGGNIQIVSSIGALTKAPALEEDGSGGFIGGDKFTIVTSRGWETTQAWEYTVGQEWLTWEELGYPADGKVGFAACYPMAEISDGGTFTFDCETAQYKDLLLAVPQEMDSYSTTPVVLNFKHALHLLEITFSADAQDYTEKELNGLSVTCTARKSCTVNVNEGTIVSTGTEKATFVSAGPKSVFILPPQPTSDIGIEFSIGENTTSMTLREILETFGNNQTELVGGSRIKLNITIDRNDGIVETPIRVDDANIAPWDDQAIVSGTINIGTTTNGVYQVSFKPLMAWGTPVSFSGTGTILSEPGDETLFESNPDVYYWYGSLNDGQKEMYRQLWGQSSVFDDAGSYLPKVSFYIERTLTQNDVNTVSSAFSKDQSSFFHFSRLMGPVSQGSWGNMATASFSTPYSTFIYRYRLFTEGADEILGRMPAGLDEFSKAKWLWDEFLKNVSYGQKEGSEGTVYGAFVVHKIVCEGYARGYQYLCQRAGIQALYIEGRAQNPNGGSEAHAWNVIRINGKYYLADPTWDDGMSAGSDAVFYKLFLKGAGHKDFVNRTLTAGYEYPAISNDDYPHGL